MVAARIPINLVTLAAFSAAARLGSLSAAARKLGVSQQALSVRVRELERDMGIELMLRSPRGVTVTSNGELVLVWAEEVLAAARRLETGIEALAGSRGRELRVVASQTIAGHLLPEWVVRLRQVQIDAGKVPTAVTLATGNSENVIERIESGESDLGFIESPDPPARLGAAVVGYDELILIVSREHPWATRTSISVAEIAATPLVARERGSGTRQYWESAVEQRIGRRPVPPLVELGTNAAVRSTVINDLAPTVISALAVSDDLLLGRVVRIPIEGGSVRRKLTALWRGGPRDLSPVSQSLLKIATSMSRRPGVDGRE